MPIVCLCVWVCACCMQSTIRRVSCRCASAFTVHVKTFIFRRQNRVRTRYENGEQHAPGRVWQAAIELAHKNRICWSDLCHYVLLVLQSQHQQHHRRLFFFLNLKYIFYKTMYPHNTSSTKNEFDRMFSPYRRRTNYGPKWIFGL